MRYLTVQAGSMFEFTNNLPLPDHGVFGVRQTFSKIFFELTSLCNNRCIFCVSWQKEMGPRGTMSLEDMQLVFKAIPDFRGRVILHLGGEAFILRDLPERCALIKHHWPHCRLHLTSTFNLDYGQEHVVALFAAGLDSLTISCYAYTKEEYKKIHGYDGFEGLCNNIRHLAKLPAGEAKSLALQHMTNVEKFSPVQDQAQKRKNFTAFAAANGVKNWASLRGDNRQGRIRTAANEAPTVVENSSPFVPNWPCDVVWGQRAGELIIGWNLDILPCCAVVSHEMVLGNLREASLNEIFSSKLYKRFYKQHWAGCLHSFPLCQACTTRYRESSPEELLRFAAWQAESLTGKEVYFWGSGRAWKTYGYLFKKTNPLAMLLDTENPSEYCMGLPVLHPDVALHPGKNIPLIIFASPPSNMLIANTITQKYPWIGPENIFWCPAAWHNTYDA